MSGEAIKAGGALAERIDAAPVAGDGARAAAFLKDLETSWDQAVDAGELSGNDRALLDIAQVRALLGGAMAGSRHVSQLLLQDAGRTHRILTADPDRHLAEMTAALLDEVGDVALSLKDGMGRLRRFKSEAALLIALSDLGGVWPIMRVTRALGETADAACQAAVGHLFEAAARKGDWLGEAGPDGDLASRSGFFVLGMGKHGAFELNYSSDIDLIVFYEASAAKLRDGLEPSSFFVRLTRDLVRLLNERTPDGYVFRTDLRLRPDPGATQIAMSTDAALQYYESFGQNWERAAMIKARPVAGDRAAGARFLKELAPFIWRKYLDFAAISDIHAMKRQIHSHKGFAKIAVGGHNIKLGRGGIREIEFFTQTQQLIAGGRQPELRGAQTLDMLGELADRDWIAPEAAVELTEAYQFLRRIEHRIQMVGDEQTHQLPSNDEDLTALAQFSGYATLDEFKAAVRATLETVQKHYAALFEDGPQLSSAMSNLVLAGEDDDPDTLASLEAMGFSQPHSVLATVRSWHRGRYPAVRSEGARARLTEVQPVLIEALSRTVNPDAALVGFDRFLATLPAGVQLFALLKAHPELMRFVAMIMGSAPRLAQILSRHRRVFDAVLDPRIIGALPTESEMRELISEELHGATDLEVQFDRARIIGREQMFLIGIRLLTGVIEPVAAGRAYTLIAEELIAQLHDAVAAEFEINHGTVAGGASAILAMGRLGSHEMTATSDVDLIVIYDFDPAATASDGAKPLGVGNYYARLTQRLISAISSPTAEGRLYEVDMRLRPSGNKGPIAVQFSSFANYQASEAWTWEHMALTRARVISGPVELSEKIEAAIEDVLTKPRDQQKLASDVREMRERIWSAKGAEDVWALKQVRGGLVDIEFIAQYLQLLHARAHPEVLDTNTLGAIKRLREADLIDPDDGAALLSAGTLLDTLTQLQRICSDNGFDPDAAPDGLKSSLAAAAGEPDIERVAARLVDVQHEVQRLYDRLVSP